MGLWDRFSRLSFLSEVSSYSFIPQLAVWKAPQEGISQAEYG
jgi:hypothetical protein